MFPRRGGASRKNVQIPTEPPHLPPEAREVSVPSTAPVLVPVSDVQEMEKVGVGEELSVSLGVCDECRGDVGGLVWCFLLLAEEIVHLQMSWTWFESATLCTAS